MEKLTDEELVHLFMTTRENKYFTNLYKRYHNKILKKCLYYAAGNYSEAEDLTHNIFIRMLEKLDTFRHEARFSTWLMSITVNYCLDHSRLKRKLIVTFQDLYPMADYIGNGDTDLTDFINYRLQRAINRLEEMERTLLVQKYQEGQSIRLLATQYALSESAVKMRLKRAKERLRYSYQEAA
ncbi:RNA polymerase sigma factor [Arsenicibacter rosenii]|uniref:RNA polymerase subunit sigma-24 n=1 Tax=Arsenicibacter rosenii TaxID=1750698 RepID=A0A1S2VGA5_9BACT|nr:sigma-70 family RNA polymerase sigma factor [Arsenicibacter rosenii]OIN57763.1 hypothetical protein BLX24_18665 [Arsenicibacter rosenii]